MLIRSTQLPPTTTMTPERKVKQDVVKILKKYDVYYFFPQSGGFGRSGVPDIVCCVEGKFLAIECKAGKNVCTSLQMVQLHAIEKAGGRALVAYGDSMDYVEGIIKHMKNGS